MGSLIAEFVDNPQRRNKKEGKIFLENGILYSYGHHFPLAFHVGEYILVNADSYSTTTRNHQSDVNRIAGNKAVAIPFSAMRTAGIPIYEVAIYGNSYERLQEFISHLEILNVKQARWETLKRKDPKTGEMIEYEEHTLGASLFKWKGFKNEKNLRPRWRYFLSGIDSTGRNRRGNYFLTELKKSAKTVDEAFEQLKPLVVKEAEKEGLEVVRQGEYFFIKVLQDEIRKAIEDEKIKKVKPCILPDIGSARASSHVAREGITLQHRDVILVRGTVRHQRGDHKMLKLGEDWWSVKHNVQKASFNANGGFD